MLGCGHPSIARSHPVEDPVFYPPDVWRASIDMIPNTLYHVIKISLANSSRHTPGLIELPCTPKCSGLGEGTNWDIAFLRTFSGRRAGDC
jgi:hypothetical protein